MSESYSSSFIPKHSAGKKAIVSRKKNYIVLSIVSYALFVSAPLASAAVFIYQRHANNQFDKAVVALDENIKGFKESDLTRVTEFATRLNVSKSKLQSHASVVNVLTAIESATAETVKFKNLDIARLDDSTLEVTGILSTSELDGALFQRATYNAKDIISSPLFTDVKIIPAKSENDAKNTTPKSVEFKTSFKFAVADVMYKSQPVPVAETTATPVESVSEVANPAVAEDTSNI